VERECRRYLTRQGLHLLQTNYRSPYGEIDLVMEHGPTLVFVEVRFRNTHRFGGALESVDRGKRLRLRRSAEHYLQQHPGNSLRPCRFDIVAVTREPGADADIQWIQNAF